MTIRRIRTVIVMLVLLAGSAAVAADHAEQSLQICFRQEDRLYFVDRFTAGRDSLLEESLDALVAGPSDSESAVGIFTAIPKGTRVNGVWSTDDGVSVDLSAELLQEGMDEARIQEVSEQFRWTVELSGQGPGVSLTVEGTPLPDFLPPVNPVGKRPEEHIVMTAGLSAGTALTGRKISLSPGHGYRWGGSGWVYDRPVYCAPLSREDLHNVDLCIYLNTYLEQDGATVPKYRCHNKAEGNDPYTGSPWWYMSGSYWLKEIGYPCSVYANSSGDCSLGTGASESSDCIVSRPVAANYDATDLHIAMHTNGLAGDCTGSCPNGTATYYDGSDATYGPPSLTFGQRVQSGIISVIQNHYADPAWRDRGVINDTGSYAETRIPNRPSVLIELAFHDTCDWDALYLQDNFFRSATMWGVYKGCCDYLGVTPTYDFYSDDYVSDTIPSVMEPGAVHTVSVTFRNRGVLWDNAHGFKLGGVGDDDPFAATRHAISGEVDPGETYTFSFTMTAPTTPGVYTTDWRMLREGVAWFGAVHSEQVTVGSGPFPPAITQHPSPQTVVLGGNGAMTVQSSGTLPLSYQWQKNGADLDDDGHVTGSHSATLQITGVIANDEGNYRCVVTNDYGMATSNAAALTVQVEPVGFIVESRSGGKNYDRFSRIGTWSDSTAKSSASGTTTGIGTQWTSSTYAARSATYSYTPEFAGTYEMFVTWPTSTNACPSVEHIITHASGSSTVFGDQLSNSNAWNSLGQYTLQSGTAYSVTQRTDGSTGGGVLRADAVKWELLSIAVDPPAITQHPAGATLCPSDTVAFNVQASGTGLFYRWQLNGNNLSDDGRITGSETPTLQISNIGLSDVGGYRCVASNSGGSATSNAAPLALRVGTTVTQQPAPQQPQLGGTALFSISAIGEGTLSYQWQKDGSDLSDDGRISGSVTATLQIDDVVADDVGDYLCVVNAGCGSTASQTAALAISGPPGDFDLDGDVDMEDFGHFQVCMSGTANPHDPGCDDANFDEDSDVDDDDLDVFHACLSGANIEPPAGCGQ